ncbi:creatininase family protein [Haloarchaeobius iranensis]|uniref:Creatinine amidohydrolase n=1 Tax=Haloarchaeobius iranensis TaxID=996166 RepID=A0A1G9XD26_9EURY|nr:creatininase family protein [Haloarchaeobius iranensis]SDM94660.1 creatinine amidohydrolase [Haloarchaeobius iranensis]
MQLTDVAWTDVRDADADVAFLPVGSTEQHGPHAPLGTDAMSAAEIAARAAAAADFDPLVAPVVPVGIAEEHRQFDGTLWVSEDTFRAYVRETVESLAHHGVDYVVVVNGHGGNTAAVREVCARVTRDGTTDAVPFTWFDTVDGDLLDGLGHGGPVETSVVAAIDSGLVHPDRYDAAAAGAGDGFGDWVAGVNVAYDFSEFAEGGNVGDPSAASPERGEAVLDDAAEKLLALVDGLRERSR